MDEIPSPAKKLKADDAHGQNAEVLNPDEQALYLINIGHDLLLWGNPQRALELYNQSLGYFPLPVAFYARGVAKFLLGNLNESMADVQTAIDSADNINARLFWVSEKIVMCNAVGLFQESRKLSKSYPLPNDPKMGYLTLKALVCTDDVSWDEVRIKARVFFERYTQLLPVYKDAYVESFSHALALLRKYSFKLEAAEHTDAKNFIRDVLLQNIHNLLNVCLIEQDGGLYLAEIFHEVMLRHYLCEFTSLDLDKSESIFQHMADRVRTITFRDTSLVSSEFFDFLLPRPLTERENEPVELTLEQIDAGIQYAKNLPRDTGSIPEVFRKIEASKNQLLYGRAEDENKPDWRKLNWSDFLHLLPEFTGSNYRELFFTLRHDLAVARMMGVKIARLTDDEVLFRECENLVGSCSAVFARYTECQQFMRQQHEVAQKVSRNTNLVFQFEFLDELLFVLLDPVQKLFSIKQSNTLLLIRRILLFADQLGDELRSMLASKDLARTLLWDDNMGPTQVKDFAVAYHKHAQTLEKFKSFDLRIKEQQELAAANTLTLLYGKNNLAKKKTMIAVPFPQELSLDALNQSYQRHGVDSSKNLMFGFVFTVGFSAGIEEGRQYFVKHVFIRESDRELFKFEDMATVCKITQQALKNSVIENINEGYDICVKEQAKDANIRDKKLINFFPTQQVPKKLLNTDFQQHTHTHSEQSGLVWLQKRLEYVSKQLIDALQADPDFNRNGKVGMIAIDMVSDKSSCDACKLCMLALQASVKEGGFRAELENKLRGMNMKVSKNGLQLTSRILSRVLYGWDSQKGINPAKKHVAELKNLGIFQLCQPPLIMSANNPQSVSTNKKH